jgi:hypothetical protein
MKNLNEMTDAEKAELIKEIDDALLPIFRYVEVIFLEIMCWLEKIMAAAANAVAPPLDWLFEN